MVQMDMSPFERWIDTHAPVLVSAAILFLLVAVLIVINVAR